MRRRRIFGMIGGGLALALALYGGLSLADRIRSDLPGAETGSTANPTVQVEASLTPVSFTAVSEGFRAGRPVLRLAGQAEPGSVVVLLDRGERVLQVRTGEAGDWSATIAIPEQPMAVEAVMFESGGEEPVDDVTGDTAQSGLSIRGVETIFRIQRRTEARPDAPALLIISAPGAPTRLIQSPFGGLPGSGEAGSGPLFMGPIDYDDAGGVIFSGLSELPGRVRLYVSNTAIGDTRVDADGRWAYIASSVMPLGEYDVRAELLREGEDRVAVSVPFERLPPLPESSGDDGALSVNFEPFRWQIRRSLVGGGLQSTAIFAPE